jgi:hypothetical protein
MCRKAFLALDIEGDRRVPLIPFEGTLILFMGLLIPFEGPLIPRRGASAPHNMVFLG